MTKRLRHVLLFVAALAVLQLVGAAQLNSYVTDTAGVFPPDVESHLEEALAALEQETNGVQLVVFTEDSIPEGMSLEERTLQIAEENRIGQKDEDNGILLYLATEDRQYRWEVGYGLEPTLNAAKLGRISRDSMLPAFEEGNYALGLLRGIEKVAEELLNSIDKKEDDHQSSNLNVGILTLIIGGIIVIFTLSSALRRMTRFNGPNRNNQAFSDALNALTLGKGLGSIRSSGGWHSGGFKGGGGRFGGGGFSGRF